MEITQLTKDEAIRCFVTRQWQAWGPETRARFQLAQERLCMPMSVFVEALCITLGRPVFVYELGNPALLVEELGRKLGA